MLLAFEGIPIPPEFRDDGPLMWAYIKGYKEGKFQSNRRRMSVKKESLPSAQEVRDMVWKYSRASKGMIPPERRPKKPWEMTPEEFSLRNGKSELFADYVPDIPRVFGPPPPPPKGGGTYSFDEHDTQGETTVDSHMRRIRRRRNNFIPNTAFRR